MLGCYAVCGNAFSTDTTDGKWCCKWVHGIEEARVIGEVVGTGVVPVYFGGWSDVD
jgi:hypothetical protein